MNNKVLCHPLAETGTINEHSNRSAVFLPRSLEVRDVMTKELLREWVEISVSNDCLKLPVEWKQRGEKTI